ncbi:hypothetical protein G4Y79_05820 [Phototrophicus methaneseepsis]|uniref:Uncharacterized protein n=1 Tax=Phototrophicus methaneseepsis TaxID=2710758 RepID=A0A7S8IEP1_9CHLR|nr:hypothetical protein [Phototrophicus methaneseepsis]QPC83895.1 hypothetical protein G4Y79_05820 [Phototrophicus methaneseepsis]
MRYRWNIGWWILPLFFWFMWGGGWWFFPMGFILLFWILPLLLSPTRSRWADQMADPRKQKQPGYGFYDEVGRYSARPYEADRYRYRSERAATERMAQDSDYYADDNDYIETADGARLRVIDDDGDHTRLTIG